MNTARHAVPVLLSILLLPAASHVQAQAATLSDCQSIQDRLARYACYDTWDAASGEVRPSAPRSAPQPARTESAAPQATATTTPAVRSTPVAENSVDDFGRRQSSTRVVDGEDGAELVGKVTALEQLGPNLWVVTLEGGQRWRQMLTKRYALQVGDDVRIYSTRWGAAYRLTTKRLGGYIQVERVDGGGAIAGPLPGPRAEPAARDDEPSIFSRLFNRDRDDKAAPAASAAPAAAAADTVASVDNFGRQQARLVQADDGKAELFDRIAALDQLGPNLWVITLEGGQRWQQMLSKRYTLQVGDDVRIYPTRWGSSFRLSVERLGGYIQVQRVD